VSSPTGALDRGSEPIRADPGGSFASRAETMTGQDVRDWRVARGISQEALAKCVGVRQSWISRYELGHRSLPESALERLAEVMRPLDPTAEAALERYLERSSPLERLDSVTELCRAGLLGAVDGAVVLGADRDSAEASAGTMQAAIDAIDDAPASTKTMSWWHWRPSAGSRPRRS